MNRFIIQYHSITLASIANRAEQQVFPLPTWRLDFSNNNIVQVVGDAVEQKDNINLHSGLRIIVQCHALTSEKAETVAKNLTEHLLNMVTLSTLAFSNPAQLVSIIEFTGKQLPLMRNFIYPFDGQELLGSLAPINESEFREIFDAFNRCADQQRIARALSWLRKGINEENFVDEFTANWIGLEVIAGVLRRMLKMRVQDPGPWDGLEDVYERELGFSNFNDVKGARDSLLHGFKELSDSFIKEIASYVVPTRQTLIASVARIIGLSKPTRDALLSKQVRRLRRKPWIVVEGELQNLPADFDELIKNYPSVRPTSVTTGFSLSDEGTLNLNTKVTKTFLAPAGVTWHPKSSEQWGDEDAGIIKASVGT